MSSLKVKTTSQYIENNKGNFTYAILKKVREVILENVSNATKDINWGAPGFI